MRRKLSPEAEAKIALRELQRRIDSYHVAATVLPLEYLEAIACLAHLAVNGLRRPDDLGGHITGHHAESTGTRLPHPAATELRRLVERLERDAERIDEILNRYDPPAPGEGDGTMQSIGAA